MEKFNNKYRIPSARYPNWDYSSAGAYFITICTHNREHYFGEIARDQLQYSNIGIIADILWHQIPYHRQNLELGEFVVTPNHVHGILMIAPSSIETLHATSVSSSSDQTLHATSLPPIPPKPNSISTIVRSYKSAVTRHAHRFGFEFQWQTRFHDHIIRDDRSFQKISEYIINNPSNWRGDKFF
ncbi:MAG TPA: transposase [Flavobacterium sp.]|jgi:REP element-mobilizing transposase RayT